MNDTVVAIVSAFFIIGIAAGIIAVVAMSVLRAERRGQRGERRGQRGERRGHGAERRGHRGDYADPVDDDPYGPGEPPQGSGWDDTEPDGQSRWPGDADTDFRGR
jgi:hypothetical protein